MVSYANVATFFFFAWGGGFVCALVLHFFVKALLPMGIIDWFFSRL